MDSRYMEARRRVERNKNSKDISDKEIIEFLEEEIEYYRNTIFKMKSNENEKDKNKCPKIQCAFYASG